MSDLDYSEYEPFYDSNDDTPNPWKYILITAVIVCSLVALGIYFNNF